jgi:hypothetical protein
MKELGGQFNLCKLCKKVIDMKHTYYTIGPKGIWHADCYIEAGEHLVVDH